MADLRTTLAARLGCTPAATDHDLVRALDEALAETRESDNVEVLDRDTARQLRDDAELGRGYRHQNLISDAVRQGKVPPASVKTWATLLATDPNAEDTLAGLRAGTIPVAPVGYGRAGDEQDEQALY